MSSRFAGRRTHGLLALIQKHSALAGIAPSLDAIKLAAAPKGYRDRDVTLCVNLAVTRGWLLPTGSVARPKYRLSVEGIEACGREAK